MPPKLDPGGDRTKACLAAAEDLLSRRVARGEPRSVNATAKEFGLNQQTLDKFIKSKQLGIEFADQIAAVFETTVDGLVWRFLKGGEGFVRAGDVPGWARAVEEARSAYGGEDHDFSLAAEVRLPVAPRLATKEFAYDLAQVFQKHTRASGARPIARRAAR